MFKITPNQIRSFIKVNTLSKCNMLYYKLFSNFFFVSFPKSGRTWVKVILYKYFTEYYKIDIKSLNFKKIFKKNKKMPLILFTHFYEGVKKIKNKKEHFSRAKNKNIIFLIRNPRDVVVSYYFHLFKRDRTYTKNIHEFIKDENYGIKRTIDFMNDIYKNRDKYNKLFFIKYEALKNDPEKEIKKLLRFIEGDKINHDILKKAIEFGNFENMKKLEEINYFNNSSLKAKNKNDNNNRKTRKGKINGYLDYLSEEDIEYVEEQMLKLNEVFGYKK